MVDSVRRDVGGVRCAARAFPAPTAFVNPKKK